MPSQDLRSSPPFFGVLVLVGFVINREQISFIHGRVAHGCGVWQNGTERVARINFEFSTAYVTRRSACQGSRPGKTLAPTLCLAQLELSPP